MYLRSGQLQTPPQRVYSCAYQIFYKEQLPYKLDQGIGINMVGSAISKDWAELSQLDHDRYQEIFQTFELQFQEKLLYFYGGTDQDFQSLKELKNIPKKPTRPVVPQIQYVYDNRDRMQENFPNKSSKQIYSELIEEYGGLDTEFKEKLEKDYEKKLSEYQKQIENWNDSYADQYKILKSTLEEKLKRSKQDGQFEYKELIFSKSVRKLGQIKQEECRIASNIKLKPSIIDKENEEYIQLPQKNQRKLNDPLKIKI